MPAWPGPIVYNKLHLVRTPPKLNSFIAVGAILKAESKKRERERETGSASSLGFRGRVSEIGVAASVSAFDGINLPGR